MDLYMIIIAALAAFLLVAVPFAIYRIRRYPFHRLDRHMDALVEELRTDYHIHALRYRHAVATHAPKWKQREHEMLAGAAMHLLEILIQRHKRLKSDWDPDIAELVEQGVEGNLRQAAGADDE